MSRLGTRRRLGCSPMVGRAPTACRQPEAAHASTNSRPTPAIRSMHAYRQQHKPKKIDHTHKWGQNPNSPQIRACSAFRARTRCRDACDAWARPPRASPRTIAALPMAQTAAALRQCSRVRGLPDADDTPRHATDSTRHARHPACSDQWPSADLAPEPPCAPRRQ